MSDRSLGLLVPFCLLWLAGACQRELPTEESMEPFESEVLTSPPPLGAPEPSAEEPVLRHPAVELNHDGLGRPACQIEVSGHQRGSWSTDWHPREPGVPHPTHARSTYWANESELEVIKNRRIAFPLEFTCAGPVQGGPGGAFSALSRGSTEKDVPLGAGRYELVAGSGNDARPGEFAVGILLIGEHVYRPTRGKLEISRFDRRGVQGSFELGAKLSSDAKEEVKVRGRFDIPCGDVAQSKCKRGGAAGSGSKKPPGAD